MFNIILFIYKYTIYEEYLGQRYYRKIIYFYRIIYTSKSCSENCVAYYTFIVTSRRPVCNRMNNFSVLFFRFVN